MHYFVKNNVLHKFPVTEPCKVRYGNEIVRDTKPHGVEECIYCLRVWPQYQEKPGKP